MQRFRNCPACLRGGRPAVLVWLDDLPAPNSVQSRRRRKDEKIWCCSPYMSACLPASQERAGEREREVKGMGSRYIGGQAQVQCGPPFGRPSMYTTHGGTSTFACSLVPLPASHPPPPLLPTRPRVSPTPLYAILPSTRGSTVQATVRGYWARGHWRAKPIP